MRANDTIEWDSKSVTVFDSQYKSDKKFIERYHIWRELINTYSNSNSYVLDVGCGTGVFSFYAAERNKSVIGIDIDSAMIRVCENKKSKLNLNNISFFKCDLNSLNKMPVKNVDIVICSSVLEYIQDLDKSLKLLSSLVKKNGVLILSLPNGSSIYRNIEPVIYKIIQLPKYYRYVKNVLSLERASAKLRGLGLDIIDSKYYAGPPIISKIMRGLGLPKYSDYLFVIVAKKS